MIAASSACDRACATFSIEPIASATIERIPQHDHAGRRAERCDRSADEHDDEELEREVRPVLRRVADPGELDAERAGEPGGGARHRERRHAQPQHRDTARRGSRFPVAGGGETETEGRACERSERDCGERHQPECELVVPCR